MTRRIVWIPLFLLLILSAVLGMALFRGGNPDAVASPLKGQPAPPLDVVLLLSQNHLTSQMLQGKPHLVNFFASWCGPCAEENDVLMSIAKEDKVKIYGIAMKDDADPLMHYLAKRGDPYDKVAFDGNGHVALDWGVNGIPETFAIDAHGNIIDRVIGGMTERDARRLVDDLLQSGQ